MNLFAFLLLFFLHCLLFREHANFVGERQIRKTKGSIGKFCNKIRVTNKQTNCANAAKSVIETMV